jgi:predicted solute-binding protein
VTCIIYFFVVKVATEVCKRVEEKESRVDVSTISSKYYVYLNDRYKFDDDLTAV